MERLFPHAGMVESWRETFTPLCSQSIFCPQNVMSLGAAAIFWPENPNLRRPRWKRESLLGGRAIETKRTTTMSAALMALGGVTSFAYSFNTGGSPEVARRYKLIHATSSKLPLILSNGRKGETDRCVCLGRVYFEAE